MTSKEQLLAIRIQKTEDKLEELKSKYIVLYGYRGLHVNEDGSVSEDETTGIKKQSNS